MGKRKRATERESDTQREKGASEEKNNINFLGKAGFEPRSEGERHTHYTHDSRALLFLQISQAWNSLTFFLSTASW